MTGEPSVISKTVRSGGSGDRSLSLFLWRRIHKDVDAARARNAVSSALWGWDNPSVPELYAYNISAICIINTTCMHMFFDERYLRSWQWTSTLERPSHCGFFFGSSNRRLFVVCAFFCGSYRFCDSASPDNIDDNDEYRTIIDAVRGWTKVPYNHKIILPLSVQADLGSFSFRRRVRKTSDKCQQKLAKNLENIHARAIARPQKWCTRTSDCATQPLSLCICTSNTMRTKWTRTDGPVSRCQQTTFGFSSLYVPFEKEYVAYNYHIHADDDDEQANGEKCGENEMRRGVANEEKESQFIPISFDNFVVCGQQQRKSILPYKPHGKVPVHSPQP